jgi:NADPH:quinone reductase
MKAIQVKQCGSPEAMEVVELPQPVPGPKQALVKVEASGINFIDIYFCTGLYKADLPFIPGMEAAGVVEAIGPEVTEIKV